MQIANCWLKMDKLGSNIPLRGVTPAEVAMLRMGHEANVDGDPISDVIVYGTVQRDSKHELLRLKQRYVNLCVSEGNNRSISVFDKLFSGMGAVAPETFDQIGVKYVMGENLPLDNSPDFYVSEGETVVGTEEVEPCVDKH